MTSQSLLQSKKMLKKELELVSSLDEAKQIEKAGLIAVALFDFKVPSSISTQKVWFTID